MSGTKKTVTMRDYNLWLQKYAGHLSGERSASLMSDLAALNFPQRTWQIPNKLQYKQIKIIKKRKLAILTSMFGRSIRIYSLRQLEKNNTADYEILTLPIFEKRFKHQVVEVCLDPAENYAFFSLTDFGKENLKDKIVCINLKTFKKVFEVETGGQWSKQIAYHPDKLLMVSNWHSNDLSVIDIKNLKKPRLVQIIPCGISPRGIGFTPDGIDCVVAGFYSRNLTYIKYEPKSRRFFIDKISDPFDFPNYSGNMRHVVVDKDGQYAFVSNLGRSLIHKVDIKQRKIIESYPCGTHPNTIALSEDDKYLAVSCRQSNIACILNTSDGKIRSIVDTGPFPTGLDFCKESSILYNLYVTNFEDDSIICSKLYLVD